MTKPRVIKVSEKEGKPRVVGEVDSYLLIQAGKEGSAGVEGGKPLSEEELRKRIEEDQEKRKNGFLREAKKRAGELLGF